VAASWDGSAGGHPSSSELDHELDAIDRAAASKKTKKSRKTEEDLINELEQRLLALDTEKQQLLVQNAIRGVPTRIVRGGPYNNLTSSPSPSPPTGSARLCHMHRL
jgi:hypothetical protein